MAVRGCHVHVRRDAVTAAALSLLVVVVLLVFHRRHSSSDDVCSNSTQSQRHSTGRAYRRHASPPPARTAAVNSRSQLHDELQRGVADLRPTDSRPPVPTSATPVRVQQFVLHRCPRSYNISDPQDDWFRTAVVQRSPVSSRVAFTDEILVLTPVCNAEQHLRRYFENLCSLAYPHRLLSVVLGEDSSDDNTVQVLYSVYSRNDRQAQRSSTIGRSTPHPQHDRILRQIITVATVGPFTAVTVTVFISSE